METQTLRIETFANPGVAGDLDAAAPEITAVPWPLAQSLWGEVRNVFNDTVDADDAAGVSEFFSSPLRLSNVVTRALRLHLELYTTTWKNFPEEIEKLDLMKYRRKHPGDISEFCAALSPFAVRPQESGIMRSFLTLAPKDQIDLINLGCALDNPCLVALGVCHLTIQGIQSGGPVERVVKVWSPYYEACHHGQPLTPEILAEAQTQAIAANPWLACTPPPPQPSSSTPPPATST